MKKYFVIGIDLKKENGVILKFVFLYILLKIYLRLICEVVKNGEMYYVVENMV